MDIKEKLGIRVRELRKQNWLSQEDLSGKCWLHRTYISDIERGVKNVSLENIEKISLSLGISISDLFSFKK